MGIHTSKLICYSYVTTGSHTITTVNDTNDTEVVALTAHRTGELAVELDLNALVAAAEGGTVSCRLKHKIDESTVRIIDLCEFIIGTDTVHPTLVGWVDHQVATSVQVTIQCSSGVTVDRAIPFKVIEA